MNNMKILLALLLLLPSLLFGQLDGLVGKTKSQLSTIVEGSTVPNKSFLENTIYQRLVNLINSFQERSVTTKDFSSFSAAIDSANARDALLFVNSRVTLSANKTVENLYVAYGGRITIAAGTTLTVSKFFDALPDTAFIYSHASTSLVSFGDGAVKELYPEWWGAKNDSTVDSSTPFQRAVNAAPRRHTDIRLTAGKGYILTSTVLFPQGTTGREITLRGNGATIWSSGSDTVFVINNLSNSSNGPKYPRHSIEHLWMKRITGQEDAGVAIVIWNSVEQLVKFCHIQDYKNAIVLYNTTQNSVAGWTEGVEIANMRFTNNDTGIAFKSYLSGAASFANTRLEHLTFAAGASARGKFVNHIFINSNARIYTSVFDQVYFALSDSTTGLYCDGKMDGTWGFLRIEGFNSTVASPEPLQIAMDFGANATNILTDFFVGVEGMNHMNYFIRTAKDTLQLNGITVQIVGDGNNANRGFTRVINDSSTTRLESVIRNKFLNYGVSAPAPADHDYVLDRDGNGKMILRARGSLGMDFRTIEGGDSSYSFLPVRIHDIGAKRTINDSTTINVKQTTHLLLGSNENPPVVQTLTTFANAYSGQNLTVVFADDSTTVANLSGGTGRIFLKNGRDFTPPAKTRMSFIAETDGTGIFWRELYATLPVITAPWNPVNLTAGSVDSTTVIYGGAVQGDPVTAGLSTIGSANANFDLKAHVISNNTVRVFVTNRSAGTYDIANGTLSVKIER